MTMINGIKLSRLKNAEYDQFITDALALVNRNDPVALMVKAEFDALKTESDRLNELLNPDKGSPLTKQLETADTRRDRCITGMSYLISGFLYHKDETIRQHAEALDRHMTLYGGAALARENYQSQTASTKSLLNDWNTQEHLIVALEALNLTEWKQELGEANQEFADIYLNRTEEAGNEKPDTVRGLRNSMNQSYYNLRNMIVSYHNVKKSANPWGQTVKQINALINKYRLLTDESPIKSALESTTIDEPSEPEQ